MQISIIKKNLPEPTGIDANMVKTALVVVSFSTSNFRKFGRMLLGSIIDHHKIIHMDITNDQDKATQYNPFHRERSLAHGP